MRFDRIRRFRERWLKRNQRDLFTRIRLRLTLTYSGMLILILLLFTLIVTGVLYMVISQELNRQVQDQAEEATAQYQDVLNRLPHGGGQLPGGDVAPDANEVRFFMYIVNADGQLVVRKERRPELRESLLEQLKYWVPQNGETRYATVFQPHHHGEQKLLLAGRAFYQDGRLAGVLYTGIDVSFYWDVFDWLTKVLLALIVLFGAVATVVGQRMAARAMVPIRSSFLKQQNFVADASHELRTPLTVLRSSIDVIDLEDGHTLSDVSKRVLADMKDEVRSMSKLVADLLTLARSDAGAVELYEQNFDLVAVAEQVIRLQGSVAQEKGIELSLVAPAPLSMTGDQERVKQLISILVDNALHYTPSGGHVTVSVHGGPRAQVLQVQDTGIGIPEEEQERIFERFYRVEDARSRAAGGTGIGLAVAKWIVDAHKGTIEVESAHGAGSTFTVRFPV